MVRRSSIERLHISGIRSFDEKIPQSIRFRTPLTLIVGDNGAGKTTIIECLKYSTTGQLPTNSSRNGAFIHDPKLSGGATEVLAQVKLGFYNASKVRHVVTRSIQATVKKNTISQKTLECMLLMEHHGEKITLSTKVGEMDKVVPEQLGVTRAVLENVIFCHQDDSLWPMSEPTVLKKKFDEIFEAQKYTKVIEALKILGKTHTTSVGKLVIYEENLKSDKDKGARLHKRSDALQEEIELHRAEHQDIEEDIKIAKEDQKEKHERKNRGMGIKEELNANRKTAAVYEATIKSLRQDMEECHESDEVLRKSLEDYEKQMRDYSQQSDEYQAQYKELQDAASDCGRQMTEKQREKGQYQAEKQNYERNVQSRIQMVKEAARTHSIRGYEGDIDDNQVLDFVDQVRKKTRDMDVELDLKAQTSNEEQRKTQATLSNLDNLRNTHTHDRVTADQAIRANDKKITLKQKELGSIKMHEGTVAKLSADLEGVNNRLQNARSSYQSAAWDNAIEKEKRRLEELKLEYQGLREEEKKISKSANQRAALTHQKKAAKEKQKSLDVMLSTYTDKLNEAIGSDWSSENLEQVFQAVLDQRSRSIANAKKLQDGAHQDLRELEIKLKNVRDSLADKKAEMQTCQLTVLNSIINEDGKPLHNVSQFLSELEDLETERNEIRNDVEGINYVSKYYREGLEIISKKNCCRLCERSFADKKERTSAADKIEKRLSALVKKDLEVELADLERTLKTANSARVQYDIYKKLHNIEVPAFEKDLEALESKRKTMVTRLEQCDRAFNQEEAGKRHIETSFSTIVTDITKYHTEISGLQVEIEHLASQQQNSGHSLSSDSDDIERKMTACNEHIQNVEGNLQSMTDDRGTAKNEISNLQVDSQEISNTLNMANVELNKMQRLRGEIKELQDDINQQRQNINAAEEALVALGPRIEKANRLHADAQRRGRDEAKIIQDEKTKLDNTVNQFNLIDDSINVYIEDGGEGKLAACQRSIKALEMEQKQIQIDMNRVITTVNSLKKKIEQSEYTKRVYQDNLRYRKTREDLDTVKKSIAELEARKVTDDFDQLSHEAALADNVLRELIQKDGQVRGQMKAKDDQLKQMWEEYERDYMDSAEKYKEMHIKVETTKAAIDDMKKYREALDNAIMKYHSMKMEEINSIAGELWGNTYQGTDVDTIKIRSENEASTSTRNTYNYRVVMVKGDAEMDMRGRCSAGQRVLASIIIRLALAESFGANCGVIALDEPTTNLDKDNIKALADSLNKIIRHRQIQSNFQLVIITHDEEFLREMKCSEFTDHYYEIKRNPEQKSMITKKNLNAMM